MALAWGVLAAGILQLALQLPFVAQLGLLVRPRRVGFSDARVKQVMKLMLPAMFGVSVAQINLLYWIRCWRRCCKVAVCLGYIIQTG